MNKLDKILDILKEENIFIHYVAEIPCYNADALFVARNGTRMILVLEYLKNNIMKLTEVLAEELGHYYTTTGHNYSISNYFEKLKVDKCENKALKWASEFLIEEDDLRVAFLNNFYHGSLDTIADELSVTKDMLVQRLYYLSLKDIMFRLDDKRYIVLTNFPSIYPFEEK